MVIQMTQSYVLVQRPIRRHSLAATAKLNVGGLTTAVAKSSKEFMSTATTLYSDSKDHPNVW
jgi:hypothetical protein